MFKRLKAGLAFNGIAKAMERLYVNIQELKENIKNSEDPLEYKETLFMMTYVARVAIVDVLHKYNYASDNMIIVPSIGRERVPFISAYFMTVSQLPIIAEVVGLEKEVQEILDRGDLFDRLDQLMPLEFKEKIRKNK